VRQRLLQGQPLLKDVALHDAVEEATGQLPTGLRSVAREVDQGGLAVIVVLRDGRDPLAVIAEGISVRGQHQLDLEPPDAGE